MSSGLFALFKQLFQVAEVVAGDENARALADAGFHPRDLRFSVSSGIGLIQQRHGFHRDVSALEHQSNQFSGGELLRSGRQRPEDEFIDCIVLSAEHRGVVRIRGDAFEAAGQQLPQRTDILVFAGEHAERSPGRGRAGQFLRTFELRRDPGFVEIRVGDGHEQGLYREKSEFPVRLAGQRQQLQLPDQLIHAVGGFGFLSADAAQRAAGVLCGLLTLEAEHALFHPLFSF